MKDKNAFFKELNLIDNPIYYTSMNNKQSYLRILQTNATNTTSSTNTTDYGLILEFCNNEIFYF